MSEPMYPFIEGPDMNWMVDDLLYARLHMWKLKCENILEANVASLSDTRKYKILLRWSSDQGLEMY